MKLETKLLTKNAKMPKYGKDLDVGADIFLPDTVILHPYTVTKVPLGISVNIPNGYEGQIRPRSGTLLRGIIIHNPPIDPGYTGEIHALVSIVDDRRIICEAGDRICQLVVSPIVRCEFTNKINNTRGNNAFNSTGK